jgi:hypothetical protein
MMAHRSNTHLKSRYVPISAFLANNAGFYQILTISAFFAYNDEKQEILCPGSKLRFRRFDAS